MFLRKFLAVAVTLIVARPVLAQYYQTDFTPDEFKARWQKVFERIGDNAVAVFQGMPKVDGFIFPRQYNNFYYLSGIETPGAYLLLDGRTKSITLYLPPRDEALERAEGRVLSASDVDLVKRLTGVDDVKPLSAMAAPNWPVATTSPGGRAAAAIYAEFSPAEGAEQSRGELVAAETARAVDYWDGGVSRQRRFGELLRARNPRTEIKDVNPILDELRGIKSPREIELIRRASEIAGWGLMEAMRSTEAGVAEYQLDAAARYEFLVNGARLEAYRSITAAGVENINNMHYYRNTDTLVDGDLVLMDYAPDYRYYVSDIGRVWPVKVNMLRGSANCCSSCSNTVTRSSRVSVPGQRHSRLWKKRRGPWSRSSLKQNSLKKLMKKHAGVWLRQAAVFFLTRSEWRFTMSADIADH